MQILIKGARVMDPGNLDAVRDVLIREGRIAALPEPGTLHPQDATLLDARGLVLVPGLVDMHVHLREPGHEYKETIETGLLAAARGGFTAVCAMPNTRPVNDTSQITTFLLEKARNACGVRLYPAGAITRGSAGTTLAEIHDMQQAGIRAVTDDGLPVENARIMRRALEYCTGLNLPVLVHAEDKSLTNDGSMNEGPPATFWGIRGIPNAAEAVMVARDILLSELTGAHVHFCHISTEESIAAIRVAKARGIRVTCETAPHYFTLTDADVSGYDTHFKMNPPLRAETDRLAVIRGLSDGTIDVIASDHAPHSSLEKDLEFDRAAFGIIGLETSLPLSLKLVQDGHLTLETLVEKMSRAPARILGIDNRILPGNAADLTLLDPEVRYTVDPASFASKSRNTPFAGREVRGRAVMTLVEGQVIFQHI